MKPIFGVLTVAVLLPLLGAENNPAAGTWKLNLEKSKFSSAPAPKGATLIIDGQGDSVKTSFEEIEADDSRVGYGYTAALDGKDYPLTGSSRPALLRGAETVTLRPNGSHAYSGWFKKSGQVVMSDMITVSKDAKTLKMIVNSVDAKDQRVTLMTVWDKQ